MIEYKAMNTTMIIPTDFTKARFDLRFEILCLFLTRNTVYTATIPQKTNRSMPPLTVEFLGSDTGESEDVTFSKDESFHFCSFFSSKEEAFSKDGSFQFFLQLCFI